LPPVGDKKALVFDGHNVDDFVTRLEELALANGVPEADLPKAVLKYASRAVRQTLIAERSFGGADWKTAKERLKLIYETMNDSYETSPKRLRTFVTNARKKKYVSSLKRLGKYHIHFLKHAGNMVDENVMGSTEHDHLFYSALPSTLREALRSDLVAAVKARTSKQMSSKCPPTVQETMTAARAYYAADELNDAPATDVSDDSESSASSSSESDDSPSDSDSDSSVDRSRRRSKDKKSKKKSKPQKARGKRERTKSSSDGELELRGQINALTQQIKTLALAVHQDRPLGSTSTQAPAAIGRTCWMCGRSEQTGLTHAIGLRFCPETQRLLREKRIVFHPETGRVVNKDLSEFPPPAQLPYGIAAYLDSLARSGVREQPPHLANAHSIGLLRDGAPVVSYATCPPSAHSAYSHPVTTRSKAAQSPATKHVHFEASDSDAEPQPSQQRREPAPAPTPSLSSLPNPPPVNTREGWQGSQHNKPSFKAGARAPPVRFTSDVQESVSVDALQEQLLSTRIEMSLREALAIAPSLQKRFGALVKVRRESDGATRTVAQAALTEVDVTPPSLEAAVSFEQGVELLEDVVERYAASVSLGQPRQYAMVSGLCEGVFGDQRVTFLVDTGSELNLINQDVWKRTNLDLDRDGARWSLRGLGGAPVTLLGCIRDAPIQLGGKNFDHHFFVSTAERTVYDGILGQPWLSYFAAEVSYETSGDSSLTAYPSRSRSGPSVTLQICTAGHPRNADRLVL
ncbi:hypothetical protein C8Q76DRAFT_588449, partial [Earliella scabrosa]